MNQIVHSPRPAHGAAESRSLPVGYPVGLVAIVVCLVLLAVSLHINHSTIQRVVRKIVVTEEPTSAAAFEMEINVLEAGLHVEKYLATGDPRHRQRILEDDADFRRFRGQYERLAETAEERELGRRLDPLYESYFATGQRLMDARDERAGLYARLIEEYIALDRILDQELEPLFDRDSRSGLGMLRRTSNIESDLASMTAWLGIYASTSDPVHRHPIFKNMDDAGRRLTRMRDHTLTAEADRKLSAAESAFPGAAKSVERVVTLIDSMNRDLAAFTTRRNEIDDLLDEGIQAGTLADLEASSSAAGVAIARLYAASSAIVGLTLLVSILASVTIHRRSTQLAATNQELRAAIAHARASDAARALGLKHLVSAEEEERGRLARELHDQMGQRLSALMMGLKAFASRDGGSGPALQGLLDLTGRLVEQVHTIAWDLRPAALDDLGLTGALSNYVEEWERRTGVEADFVSQMNGVRLPGPVETTLYRVAQEALTNVHKHSGARSVSLILEQSGSEVRVVVEDDGDGFDAGRSVQVSGAKGHLGLLGMKERAILAGGSLEIESAPGVGTTVVVRIPIREAAAEKAEEGA